MSIHVHTHVLETTTQISNWSSGTAKDLTVCYVVSCGKNIPAQEITAQRCDETAEVT